MEAYQRKSMCNEAKEKDGDGDKGGQRKQRGERRMAGRVRRGEERRGRRGGSKRRKEREERRNIPEFISNLKRFIIFS